MQNRKLRIGLLLDGIEVAAWEHRMIEIIRQSDYAEISLIVQNTLPAERRLTPAGQLARKIRSGQFWTTVIRLALTTLERLLIGKPGSLPDASKQVDGKELLAGVDVIKVNPRRQRFFDYIEGDELANIRVRDIDVFIRLGFRILRGGILGSARYGVWSYHHGDNRVNRGGPACYWEAMESSPESGSVLQILTRSEEHTSELQSPCISYAVFCLKKKSTRLNSSHLLTSHAVLRLENNAAAAIPRRLCRHHRRQFHHRVNRLLYHRHHPLQRLACTV